MTNLTLEELKTIQKTIMYTVSSLMPLENLKGDDKEFFEKLKPLDNKLYRMMKELGYSDD